MVWVTKRKPTIRGTNKTAVTVRSLFLFLETWEQCSTCHNDSAHHLYCTRLITWAIWTSIGPERLLLRGLPTADLEIGRPLSRVPPALGIIILVDGKMQEINQAASGIAPTLFPCRGTETSLRVLSQSAECGHLPSSRRTLGDPVRHCLQGPLLSSCCSTVHKQLVGRFPCTYKIPRASLTASQQEPCEVYRSESLKNHEPRQPRGRRCSLPGNFRREMGIYSGASSESEGLCY